MQTELRMVWRLIRDDVRVRVVVLTGAGDKAFCAGIDRGEIPVETEYDPFTYEDPGKMIGPKSQGLWKPVIAAVNGLACGGAFYLLGESDIVVAAESATFFDPHVTFEMTAVYEPILLMNRMNFGDLVRMSLVGTAERMSARTARESGLVCEVVERGQLLEVSKALAETIAAQPTVSVQATLRTLWAARNMAPEVASNLGNVFLKLGTSAQSLERGQATFTGRDAEPPRVR
jgi:enoyl-CoA hydratase/carnithine racemase